MASSMRSIQKNYLSLDPPVPPEAPRVLTRSCQSCRGLAAASISSHTGCIEVSRFLTFVWYLWCMMFPGLPLRCGLYSMVASGALYSVARDSHTQYVAKASPSANSYDICHPLVVDGGDGTPSPSYHRWNR